MAFIPRGTLVLHADAAHEKRGDKGRTIEARIGRVQWCSVYVCRQIVWRGSAIRVQVTKVVIEPAVFLSHENNVIDRLQRGAETGSYRQGAGRGKSAGKRARACAAPSAKGKTCSWSCVQCHLCTCRKSIGASRAAID